MNQDDCLAINKGSNIVFQRNTCSGGHGISIVRSLIDRHRIIWLTALCLQGSISSDATVSGIIIQGNTIINKYVPHTEPYLLFF